jgi:hypothetical protein
MQQPANDITGLVVGFTACTIVAAVLATPLLGIWPALVVVGAAVAIGCACQPAREKGDAGSRKRKPARSTPKRSGKSPTSNGRRW